MVSSTTVMSGVNLNFFRCYFIEKLDSDIICHFQNECQDGIRKFDIDCAGFFGFSV